MCPVTYLVADDSGLLLGRLPSQIKSLWSSFQREVSAGMPPVVCTSTAAIAESLHQKQDGQRQPYRIIQSLPEVDNGDIVPLQRMSALGRPGIPPIAGTERRASASGIAVNLSNVLLASDAQRRKSTIPSGAQIAHIGRKMSMNERAPVANLGCGVEGRQ